jgi:hypothetical protein
MGTRGDDGRHMWVYGEVDVAPEDSTRSDSLAPTPVGRRQPVPHAGAKGPARRFPFAGIVRIRWMEVVGSSFNASASQPFGSLARLAGHFL